MAPKAEPKMAPNKRIKLRFTLAVYRQMFAAWKVSDAVTDRPSPRLEPKPEVIEPVIESEDIDLKCDVQSETNCEPIADQTIELLDTSLDSVPESPEFVRKETKPKKNTNQSAISSYFDFEAQDLELREDDMGYTQKETGYYSQSDIDNSTQPETQPVGQVFGGIDSRDTKDMESVYLRSTKEWIGRTSKYKLQYNFDPSVDVYSQAPTEEDMKDYEFDSFCVPNDSVEFDESADEVSIVCERTAATPERKKRSKSGKKKYKRIVQLFSP